MWDNFLLILHPLVRCWLTFPIVPMTYQQSNTSLHGAFYRRVRETKFISVQDSTNRRAPGFVNFVLALTYHFCLNLPAAFTQPRARLLVEPCIMFWFMKRGELSFWICTGDGAIPGFRCPLSRVIAYNVFLQNLAVHDLLAFMG